jgi:hypothetical protein
MGLSRNNIPTDFQCSKVIPHLAVDGITSWHAQVFTMLGPSYLRHIEHLHDPTGGSFGDIKVPLPSDPPLTVGVTKVHNTIHPTKGLTSVQPEHYWCMCPSVCTKTGWVRHQLTIAKAARAYDLLVQLECKVVQTLSLGDLPFSGSMPHKLLHTVTVAVRDALKLRYHRK